MLTWKSIIVLGIKGNTISNFFYYIHIREIPTNKEANSYKFNISKIWNCRSERETSTIFLSVLYC